MTSFLPRLFFILFFCGLLFGASPVMADEGGLPGDIFTAIMLKTLSYDRNIDRQGKDKVTIGIVYSSDDAAGQGFAGQVEDNVAKVQSTLLLKGKQVEAKSLVLDRAFDKAKFEEQLKQNNITVLVVLVKDTGIFNNVLAATRELQVSSICGAPGCAQNGVGLEIIQKDDKPHMAINLTTVKQEGCDYDSKFLSMCEVLK